MHTEGKDDTHPLALAAFLAIPILQFKTEKELYAIGYTHVSCHREKLLGFGPRRSDQALRFEWFIGCSKGQFSRNRNLLQSVSSTREDLTSVG